MIFYLAFIQSTDLFTQSDLLLGTSPATCYWAKKDTKNLFARNKSLGCAATDSDFIALIDDEEIPEPLWLDELLFAQKKYTADIVAGPVLRYFPEKDIPSWIIKGKFFELPRYRTGDIRDVTFAGNVLIKTNILRQLNPIFDNRFALTGGEDSHLFMRLHQAIVCIMPQLQFNYKLAR